MVDDTPRLDRERSALVLMDFQPAVLGSVDEPSRLKLVQKAATTLAWARGSDMIVAHVRVAFGDSDFAAIPSRNKAFAALRGGGMMIDGSPECEIVDDLKPVGDELVFRKVRFGSFSTTGLGSYLQEKGIDTLILAGVSTGGVVLSTVRDAADQDFQLYVVADACGDADSTVHTVLLERVLPHQAYVIETTELSHLV